MRHKRRRRYARVTVTVVATLLVAIVAMAQTGGGYDLSWSSVDGGGATFSTGAAYTLGGASGQPDAGVLLGGAYTLGGGFWGGGALARVAYESYLPLVLRNGP